MSADQEVISFELVEFGSLTRGAEKNGALKLRDRTTGNLSTLRRLERSPRSGIDVPGRIAG